MNFSQLATYCGSCMGCRKNIPLKFFGNISPTTEKFKIKFYLPVLCYICAKLQNFIQVSLFSSNFEKVMPYCL